MLLFWLVVSVDDPAVRVRPASHFDPFQDQRQFVMARRLGVEYGPWNR